VNQTKLQSIVEVCLSVAIGFFISFICWPYVAWWQDIPYTTTSNLQITAFFTVLSVTRGYIIRRWFNIGLQNTAFRITDVIRRQGWTK
jgi:hypothetical protein